MEKRSGTAALKVVTQSLNLELEEKLCFRALDVLSQEIRLLPAINLRCSTII